MLKRKLLFFIIILICIINLTSCSKAPISRNQFFFDTYITITIYDSTNEKLLNECMSIAKYYENLLSRTILESDIYKINHSNGRPTKVNQDTINILKLAIKYAEFSQGLVDPTIGNISSLWDFHNKEAPTLPDAKTISSLLPSVNYKNIKIKDNEVTLLNDSAQIDLGFIAKGYIADRIKEYLVSQNINSAMINLGGNILAIGEKPNKNLFVVGIQKPFADIGNAITTVEIKDCSVVSSGIYERYFKYDSKLYHHILNPKTGYPVENNLLGVTIISPNSVDADALSTICFILGQEKSMELLKTVPNTDAIFITKDFEVITTY